MLSIVSGGGCRSQTRPAAVAQMAEQEPTRSVAGGSSPSHPLQFRSAAAAPSGDRRERQGFENLRNSGTTVLVTGGFGGPVRRIPASTEHDDGRQEEF